VEILGTGKPRLIGIIGVSGLTAVLCTSLFVLPHGRTTSITWAKEHALQQDLRTIRLMAQTYCSDQHKPPRSLDDLVAAGYLKHIPKDPMTGRDDTWIVERSNDTAMSGWVNVHSGASGTSSNGSRYTDW
jgi:general secretion pathway protein G